MIYPYDNYEDFRRPKKVYKARGLSENEARIVRRNPTDPFHLFDWAQFHVAPRMYRLDPLSFTPMLQPRRAVADALFPRTRQALLVLFFQFPENWYRQTDVVRVTRMGLGSAQRELFNLELAGLVRARPTCRYRSREFSANPESPLFKVMCALASGFMYSPFSGPWHLPPDPDYLPDGACRRPCHLQPDLPA